MSESSEPTQPAADGGATTEPAPAAPATPPAGDPPNTAKQEAEPLGDGGKKALQDERKARKAAEKERADLQARLQEFEDRDKSELQRSQEQAKKAESKLTEQLAEAQAAAEEATVRALRLEVAAEKGLTPTQAKRLQGSTAEEMAADADALLAEFQGQGVLTRTHRPTDRLHTGGDPTSPPEEMDPAKLAAQVPRGW